jgi:hypothetical protein
METRPASPDPSPTGLPRLLGLAAAEPRFAEALARDRDRAVAASGVTLSATESALLAATPAPALHGLVAAVNQGLPEVPRRAFLRQAGLALLALGGAAGAGLDPAVAIARARDEETIRTHLQTTPAEPRTGSVPTTTGISPDHPRPRLRLGRVVAQRPDCASAQTRDLAHYLARRHAAGSFYDCYAMGLRTDPGLAGSLEITYQVTQDGRITKAWISSEKLSNRAVSACVLAHLRAMRLPKLEADATVKQPLLFVPHKR